MMKTPTLSLIFAEPVNGEPPLLVTTKLASAVRPVETGPKSRAEGLTPNWADEMPVPVTGLVEVPPPAVNTMLLLKAPWAEGVNRTTRFVELYLGRLNGLPENTANGPALARVP